MGDAAAQLGFSLAKLPAEGQIVLVGAGKGGSRSCILSWPTELLMLLFCTLGAGLWDWYGRGRFT